MLTWHEPAYHRHLPRYAHTLTVLRNQSVEDGFHIHTNIWICILIDAQSATGMLAEYIDDTRLRQLGQLTQNLTRYQVETSAFRLQDYLYLLYHIT